jgi:hypothetical protein
MSKRSVSSVSSKESILSLLKTVDDLILSLLIQTSLLQHLTLRLVDKYFYESVEAFAKKQGPPIFLYWRYSSSHWPHIIDTISEPLEVFGLQMILCKRQPLGIFSDPVENKCILLTFPRIFVLQYQQSPEEVGRIMTTFHGDNDALDYHTNFLLCYQRSFEENSDLIISNMKNNLIKVLRDETCFESEKQTTNGKIIEYIDMFSGFVYNMNGERQNYHFL